MQWAIYLPAFDQSYRDLIPDHLIRLWELTLLFQISSTQNLSDYILFVLIKIYLY